MGRRVGVSSAGDALSMIWPDERVGVVFMKFRGDVARDRRPLKTQSRIRSFTYWQAFERSRLPVACELYIAARDCARYWHEPG